MSPSELFWSGQKVFLIDIYLPIIIGVLVFAVPLLVIFLLGFLRRCRLWELGQPDDRSGNWWQRFGTTLAVAVTHVRIASLKEIYPGIMHALIFGGMAVLIIGKVIRLFSYITGITTPPQAVYLYASWASEVGAVSDCVG